MTGQHRNPSHVVLTSIGTDGDVYPFLGLGAELRARGYSVTLVTNEGFSDRAREAGIGFCSLFADREFEAILGNPAFWHPIQGPVVLARWGARRLYRQYEVLSALAQSRPTILVASPGVL